jgi:hypothetical protein
VRAVVVLALAVMVFGPKAVESDGRVRYDNLRNVVDRGSSAAPKFSHVGPVFSAPLLLLDRTFGTGEMILVQYNWLLFVVGVLALSRLLRPILPDDVRSRFLLLLVVGSMFPANTLNYFGETFTAMTVAVGTAGVVARRAWWGWPLVALGVANTPATAVGLALAVAVYCRHERRFSALIVLPAVAAVILGENWLARGSPFATGYENDAGVPTVLPFSGRPGFSYPFFFGVLSLLFSFGKGLVFFTPGLFLPCAMEDRGRLIVRMWVAFTVGLLLVYAKWWAWYGGLAWGPRMLLFASLPASLVLAKLSAAPDGGRGKKLLVLLAVVLSCWVGASGFAFGPGLMAAFVGENYQTEFVLWYVPECSVLWLPFVLPSAVNPAGYVFLVLGGLAFVMLGWRPATALASRAASTAG